MSTTNDTDQYIINVRKIEMDTTYKELKLVVQQDVLFIMFNKNEKIT